MNIKNHILTLIAALFILYVPNSLKAQDILETANKLINCTPAPTEFPYVFNTSRQVYDEDAPYIPLRDTYRIGVRRLYLGDRTPVTGGYLAKGHIFSTGIPQSLIYHGLFYISEKMETHIQELEEGDFILSSFMIKKTMIYIDKDTFLFPLTDFSARLASNPIGMPKNIFIFSAPNFCLYPLTKSGFKYGIGLGEGAYFINIKHNFGVFIFHGILSPIKLEIDINNIRIEIRPNNSLEWYSYVTLENREENPKSYPIVKIKEGFSNLLRDPLFLGNFIVSDHSTNFELDAAVLMSDGTIAFSPHYDSVKGD